MVLCYKGGILGTSQKIYAQPMSEDVRCLYVKEVLFDQDDPRHISRGNLGDLDKAYLVETPQYQRVQLNSRRITCCVAINIMDDLMIDP